MKKITIERDENFVDTYQVNGIHLIPKAGVTSTSLHVLYKWYDLLVYEPDMFKALFANKRVPTARVLELIELEPDQMPRYKLPLYNITGGRACTTRRGQPRGKKVRAIQFSTRAHHYRHMGGWIQDHMKEFVDD